MVSKTVFKAKSPLIDRVRAAIRSEHKSIRTEDSYVFWIVEFVFWANMQNPANMGDAEVGAFLTYLAENNYSKSSLKVALNALQFYIEHRNMKTHRSRANLPTFKELGKILAAIPVKYRPALVAGVNSKQHAKRAGYHYNSLHNAVRAASLGSIGRGISVGGVQRSALLKEITDGSKWEEVEKRYGDQAVKTACADFVRQFGKKILVDNLG